MGNRTGFRYFAHKLLMNTPMSIRRSIPVLCLLLFAQRAFSQTPAPDHTPLVAASVSQLQQEYTQAFPINSQLYNGPEYVDFAKRYRQNIGHQFFLSPEKAAGSVHYNDHYFPDLQLVYDILSEQVILQQPTNPLRFRLVSEKLREFSVAGHRFIRIETDSTNQKVVQTGFYEVLEDNTLQVLAKRAKRMQEHVNQGQKYLEFVETNKLFIKKSGVFYSVSSKGSVTRLLADRSKEIQKYIRDNKLKFNKNTRESDIIQVVRFYNSLV
ncbi:hypothetical protein LRS06_08670 [Hymenobacter sp. J193]|uniref:hypothetical protein n=1 Tax=Hymenobacter sp. J193 TaxID=2898429 RepID=UPI00215115B4|nr:hypothetical protein [Hymenobacter sp. J193]MCR5887850.1 hypothetical protein [Hymenobacter sp. J193]